MREKIKERLIDYFGTYNYDSYYYVLDRDKSAFNDGTMTFDDFRQFDEDIIDDIMRHLDDLLLD